MTTYIKSSMVKKGHGKIIAEKLDNLGSKIPNNLDLEKEHCLANLLHLASGNGKYKLSFRKINQIKDDEFSINWQ